VLLKGQGEGRTREVGRKKHTHAPRFSPLLLPVCCCCCVSMAAMHSMCMAFHSLHPLPTPLHLPHSGKKLGGRVLWVGGMGHAFLPSFNASAAVAFGAGSAGESRGQAEYNNMCRGVLDSPSPLILPLPASPTPPHRTPTAATQPETNGELTNTTPTQQKRRNEGVRRRW